MRKNANTPCCGAAGSKLVKANGGGVHSNTFFLSGWITGCSAAFSGSHGTVVLLE